MRTDDKEWISREDPDRGHLGNSECKAGPKDHVYCYRQGKC